ncbi:hypothetical protein BJ742DRAFT_672450 [Cladochytrium replicatum]|nr:hypothetical protein BJ742DRAFT_672450 [Cladochytrium replicatum]
MQDFFRDICGSMSLRHYQPGDVVVREGDMARAMFFVVKGTVTVISGDGEITFAELSAGSFFGEIGILFNIARTATVSSKTKCVLAALTADTFQKRLAQYPEVSLIINAEAQERFKSLARELERAGKKLPSASFVTAEKITNLKRVRARTIGSPFLPVSVLTVCRITVMVHFEIFRRTSDVTSENPSLVERVELVLGDRVGDTWAATSTEAEAEPPSNRNSLLTPTFSFGSADVSAPSKRTSMQSLSALSSGSFQLNSGSTTTGATLLEVLRSTSSSAAPAVRPIADSSCTTEFASTTTNDLPALQESSSDDGGWGSELSEGKNLTTSVQSFITRNNSKRRASVAVWSDDKLLQFAQQIAAPGLTIDTESESSGKKSPTSPRSPTSAEDAAPRQESEVWNANSSSPAVISKLRPKPLKSSGLARHSSEVIDFENEDDKLGGFLGPLGRRLGLRILRRLNFRSLYKLRRLSKVDLQLLLDPELQLLSKVDISSWNKRVDDNVVCNFICFAGKNLTHLNLTNCWSVTDKSLQIIAQYAPNVESLLFASLWEITDAGVGPMSRNCPQIREIDFSNCRKLSDSAIISVLEGCRSLQSLTLSYCKNLTDAIFDHPNWVNIKHLNIQRCTAIFDPAFLHWKKVAQAAAIVDNRPASPQPFEMEELFLSDCSFLTDTAVSSISSVGSKLRVLSLSFCCALTEDSLVLLSRGCPQLQVLDLSFCGGAVTDSSLETLGKGLTSSLERLSVRGCIQVTNTGLCNLEVLCPLLFALNVSQCKFVQVAVFEGSRFKFLKGGESLLSTDLGILPSLGQVQLRHERSATA